MRSVFLIKIGAPTVLRSGGVTERNARVEGRRRKDQYIEEEEEEGPVHANVRFRDLGRVHSKLLKFREWSS